MGSLGQFFSKKTYGFTSVVKGQNILSESGGLEYFAGSKLIDFIIIYQTNIVLSCSHSSSGLRFIEGDIWGPETNIITLPKNTNSCFQPIQILLLKKPI